MSSTPAQYNRQTNFVTEAQGNANITVSQIATELDAEFDAVNTSLDATQSRLAEIQRDDGALRNGIVTSASLTTDLLNKITTADNSYRGVWAVGTTYYVGDVVYKDLSLYYCAIQHTAANFTTELNDGDWTLVGATASDTNDPNAYVPLTRWSLVPNSTATVFTITGTTVTNSAAYLVTVDGVLQDPASYTITTNTITFSEAPPSGTSVVVVGIGYAKGIAVGSVGTTNLVNGAVTPAKLSAGGPSWDTSGNVGIGTSSPSRKLEVQANGAAPQSAAARIAAVSSAGAITNQAYLEYSITGGGGGLVTQSQIARYNSAYEFATYFEDAATWRDNTTNTERMRINSAGNVGIGTVSPSWPLVVKKSSAAVAAVQTDVIITSIQSNDDGGWGAVGTASNHAFIATTNNQERLRIQSNGNVGIGTSSPTAKLDVNGTAALNLSGYGFLRLGNADNNGWAVSKETSDNSLNIWEGGVSGAAVANRVKILQGGTINTQGNPITNCPTTAKAFVNFNGSTSAIRTSYNVSSVTRNGVGDYSVNFSTALSNANYSAVATIGQSGTGTNAMIAYEYNASARSTSSVRIATGDNNADTFNDMPFVSVQIFGN